MSRAPLVMPLRCTWAKSAAWCSADAPVVLVDGEDLQDLLENARWAAERPGWGSSRVPAMYSATATAGIATSSPSPSAATSL